MDFELLLSLRSEEVAQLYERGNRLLVTSAESFLAGTYENYLLENNQIVPVWAPLNCLAHGDTGAISEMAKHADPFDLLTPLGTPRHGWQRGRHWPWTLSGWSRGRAALLNQVQRRILVPIESVLMEQNDVSAPELVVVTKAALRSVRARRRREGLTFAQLRGEGSTLRTAWRRRRRLGTVRCGGVRNTKVAHWTSQVLGREEERRS
jgi:hypothetical protein